MILDIDMLAGDQETMVVECDIVSWAYITYSGSVYWLADGTEVVWWSDGNEFPMLSGQPIAMNA